MLDYKLVQALAMVVREGGFEKAAKVLHLTQSAVSQRVKLLEEQSGQVLLVRSLPPRATRAGQNMLGHYRRVERLEGDLFQAMTSEGDGQWQTLTIALNADSLETWFLDAVRPFLRSNQVLLDLHIDDQEQTHKLLRSGEVVGCVSARVDSVQGCHVLPLGRMVYRLVATPEFAMHWFPEGVTREACETAPAVIYNRDDEMHAKVLVRAFGEEGIQVSGHYVPSSVKFVEIVSSGLGYGMVPEYQGIPLLRSGSLIDLAPDLALPVDLYWHCWNIGSPLLEGFSKMLTENAWMVLGSDQHEEREDFSVVQTAAVLKEDSLSEAPDVSDDLFGPG